MEIVRTERLILREFSLDDTEEIFRFSQEESMRAESECGFSQSFGKSGFCISKRRY